MTNMMKVVAIAAALLCVSEPLLAQRGRGGGGRGGGGRGGGGGGGFRGGGGMPSRGGARPSVSRPSGGFGGGGGSISRTNISGGNVDLGRSNISRGNINTGNINTGNINRANIDRNVNVGDVDVNGGYWGNGVGCCGYHPVARAAAWGTAAAITSAAIGSTVYALPSDCSVTVVNGITYQQCGSTWYEPQFSGTTTNYVVVSPP